MKFKKMTKEVEVGGRMMSIDVGKFAKQADGSAMLTYGDTMVLATVVAAEKPREGIDFFPLSVEYREKVSAAGRIPGGFFKREGKPSEKEILSSRLIDRPIRPMFPDGFRNETQIIISVYSSDQENDGDVLGACAASAALMVSDAPFDGPIAEVRVARVDGTFVVNPTFSQLENNVDLELIVAGTGDSILMVEGESNEVSETDMLEAVKFGHEAIKIICKLLQELGDEAGAEKREIIPVEFPEGLEDKVNDFIKTRVVKAAQTVLMKEERSSLMKELYEAAQEEFAEEFPEDESAINTIVHDLEKDAMRENILKNGIRLDGRGTSDIRPIECEVSVLPRTHGSALFTRGETQSLTTCTLGTKSDEQFIEGLLESTKKKFLLHYNFPPFSVGEAGRFGFTSRREIGHGNLAERALKAVLPSEEDFPYTLRIASMATVCAGSLAMMDAGVPIKKSVAGVAMGLVKEGDDVAVLSDILGNEDHLGDMDFKVAGTKDGINAYQMDIKIKGISFEIMEKALLQAKEGRLHILGIMDDVIAGSRESISQYAPQLTTIYIPIDLIGAIIGPGGKVIRQICADSGAEINIEDDGKIIIAAVDGESRDKALDMINRITQQPEEGEIYTGTVKKITDFGAFVEILPGKEGLLHISQIEYRRLNTVDEVLKVGDTVEVKLMKVEDNGKFSLSRKVLLEKPAGYEEDDRRDGGRDRSAKRPPSRRDR
jgi:polyribonucleotide nucleotidyltransferase